MLDIRFNNVNTCTVVYMLFSGSLFGAISLNKCKYFFREVANTLFVSYSKFFTD